MSVVLGSDGTLTITASVPSDAISVNFSLDMSTPTPVSTINITDGTYTIVDDGTTTDFNATGVLKLVVNGSQGNDRIKINGYEQSEDNTAIPVNLVINEGNGNDNVNAILSGDGFESGQVKIDPTVTVMAGNGNDTVFVQCAESALITAGNGNDNLGVSDSGSDALNAVISAGNGNDSISGDGAADGGLNLTGSAGTGHDTFSNGNDRDIVVAGVEENAFIISGVAYTGTFAAPTPLTGATVYMDANDNGQFDAGELSTTTDSHGDYSFTIPASAYTEASYTLRAFAAGYATASVVTEAGVAGEGISGDDFIFTPVASASSPVVFGTSGSYGDQGNTIANAVDGNLSTFFDSPTASGGYVAMNYGSPQSIKQISFAPRSGFASRMVGGVFQGSTTSTFSSPVTLYKVTSAPVVGKLTTVNVSNTGVYQYVRYLGPTNGYSNIAEMKSVLATKLAGSPIGTAGSYRNHGTTIADAVDGNFNTFFDGPDATGDWVGLDLGSAKVSTLVRFAPRAGYGSRMIGGEIQASNSANFSSGIVTLATITSTPTTGTLTTLSLNNTKAYRYYRYVGPTNSYCDISELEFDG